MPKPTVVITGGSGFIGRALASALIESFEVVILDLIEGDGLPEGAHFAKLDLTSDDAVRGALEQVREISGGRIACVFHLAAYFDLSGEDDPKYEAVTVQGTRRLLAALKDFEVERFALASTMLVHKAGRPGEKINEDWPLDPKLPYRASKIAAENLVDERRGETPVVHLRVAGVYDETCRNPFLANQIVRVWEGGPKAHAYPGDPETGQSMVHVADLVSAMVRVLERRDALPPRTPLLIGEPEALSYRELQNLIGRLLHDEPVTTIQAPKPLAKLATLAQSAAPVSDPFEKPWMVDIADDCYDLDIDRAQAFLKWQPEHRLRDVLPAMIGMLKDDPEGWCAINGVDPSRVGGLRSASC